MSKKKHLYRFTNEKTRKYEVCDYENDSYESFLDGNVEEMRGNEVFWVRMRKKNSWKLNSRALELKNGGSWWLEKLMMMAFL